MAESGSYPTRTAEIEKEEGGAIGLNIEEAPEGEVGSRIKAIVEDSAAAKCPELKVDDVITAVNSGDVLTEEHDDVIDAIVDAAAGGKFTITVADWEDVKKTLPKTATSGDDSYIEITDELRTVTIDRTSGGRLGIQVADGPEEVGGQVIELDPEGLAAQAGLRVGDRFVFINGEEVLTAEYEHVLDLLSQNVVLSIDVSAGEVETDLLNQTREVTMDASNGLGIKIISNQEFTGVRVTDIVAGSAAANTGQVHVGDHIVQVNDIDIRSADHDEAIAAIKKAGTTVTLVLEMDDSELPDENPETTQDLYSGSGVREVTIKRREGEGLGLSLIQEERVSIDEIVENTAAHAAGGLLVGDVIVAVDRNSTDNVSSDDVVQMIKDAGDEILLTVCQPTEIEEPIRTVVIKREGDEKLGIQVLKSASTVYHRICGINTDSTVPGLEEVKVGDRLRSINGVEITTHSHDQVVAMLTNGGAEITLGLQSDASSYNVPETAGVENMLEKRTVVLRKIAGGFGMVLASDGGLTRGVRVDSVTPSGPAAAAGIRPHDIIVDINNTSTLEMNHDEVVALFAQATEEATVTVQHPSAVAGASRFVTILKDASFGFEFTSSPNEGGHYKFPRISSIAEGGAAATAGNIFVGDRIISVNGLSLASRGHDEIVELLQQHEQVTLELEMDGSSSGLGSAVLSTREIQISRTKLQAIGLQLTSDMAEVPGLVITRVMTASPAAYAGAQVGEILVAIDGAPVKGRTHDDVVYMLQNAPSPTTLELGTISRIRNVTLVPDSDKKFGLVLVACNNVTHCGARIREVATGTPAAKALADGKLHRGDVIIGINGEDVSSELHADIMEKIHHTDSIMKLTLELSASPLPRIGGSDLLHATARTIVLKKVDGKSLGFRFVTDKEVKGHVVISVAKGSIAAEAGLADGDAIIKVNGVYASGMTHEKILEVVGAAAGEVILDVGHLPYIPGATTVTVARAPDRLGMYVASQDVAEGSGVVITRVDNRGNAAYAGLRPGQRIVQANGKVTIQADHHEVLSALASGHEDFATITVVPSTLHRQMVKGKASFQTQLHVKRAKFSQGYDKFGMSLVSLKSGYGARVSYVEGGSAAAAQKVDVGDRILTINGETANDMNHTQIMCALAMPSVVDVVFATDLEPLEKGRAFVFPRLQQPEKHTRIISKVMEPKGLGLGISIFSDVGEQGVKVGDIDPTGYVAEEGTLAKGDHILQIDNVDVSNTDHDEVAQTLKAAADLTSFNIVVSREDPQGETQGTVQLSCSPTGTDSGIIVFNPPLTELSVEKGQGSFTGMVLLQHEKTGIFSAGEVTPGQPAALAGVEVGDEIFAVNGQSLAGHDHKDAVALFANAGSMFKIQVRHKNAPQGVYVLAIKDGSPADSAGELQPGDRVTKIDDSDVTGYNTAAVQDMLDTLGETASLTYSRSSGSKPHPRVKRTVTVERNEGEMLGLHFMMIENASDGTDKDFVVLGTEPGSAAANAGFHDGDTILAINDTDITSKTYEEATEIFKNAGSKFTVRVGQPDSLDYGAMLSERQVTLKSDETFPRFGLHLMWDDAKNVFRILSVYPDSPAAQLGHGVRIGDCVVAINGNPCTKKEDVAILNEAVDSVDIHLKADGDAISLDHVHDMAYMHTRGCMLQRSEDIGFGLTLATSDTRTGKTIQSVISGSAAEASGQLEPGDVLYQINRKFVLESSHEQVVEMLQTMQVVDIRVIPAEEWKSLHTATLVRDGDKIGLGLVSDTRGQHRVSYVAPGTSAYYCENIRYADAVLAINGIEACTLSHDEISKMMMNYETLTFVMRTDESDMPDETEVLKNATEVSTVVYDKDVVVYKEIGVAGVRVKSIGASTSQKSPGLKVHDIIISVGGMTAIGRTAKQVQTMLGTSAQLKIAYASGDAFDKAHLNLRELSISRESAESYGLVVESKPQALIIVGNAAQRKSFEDMDHVGCRVTEVRADGALAKANVPIFPGDDIIRVNGYYTNDILHEKVADLFGNAQLSITLRQNKLPLFPEDDIVSGTTRTVTLTNEGTGFGLVLVPASQTNPCQVSEVREGSPAAKSNQVFANDILIRVNGGLIAGRNHDDIVHEISSSTTVSFTLESCETAPVNADKLRIRVIHFKKTGGPLGLKVESMPQGGACIRGCVPGTPAAATDICVGDEIVQVNGADLSRASHDDIILAIQNAPAEFTITVRPEPTRVVKLNRTDAGLGISVVATGETGVAVGFVNEGSVADESGAVFANDVILSINGRDASTMTHDEAIEALLASAEVHLELRKGEDLDLDDTSVEEAAAEPEGEAVAEPTTAEEPSASDDTHETTSFSEPKE